MTNAHTQSPRVELVALRFRSGHQKQVTRVTFADGRQVTFTDRAPKRLAIPQAIALLASGYSEAAQ